MSGEPEPVKNPDVTKQAESAATSAPCPGSANYGHNPEHAIGTCGNCGAEMVYNVPRLGPGGGYVHKATGRLVCENSPNNAICDTGNKE